LAITYEKNSRGKNIYEINMSGTFRRFKNLAFILFYYLCDLVSFSNRHSKRSNQKKRRKRTFEI
jgi:hypothetical protein